MFRFFENLVDPYAPYAPNDVPPRKMWPFLWEYLKPFKTIFILATLGSILVAGIELWLIGYLGRLVDVMGTTTASEFWADYGVELALLTAFLLLARPAIQAFDVLLLNNALMPNVGTIFRWRAHRHVLRQSVGWFENDFAGRIANRIMQTPPAAGEAVFQVFDAMAIVMSGALRGAGDTVWPGVATIILSWSCIVGLGHLLLEVAPDMGSAGPWTGAAAFIILLGTVLVARFRSGKWKTIKLIEE